MDDLTLARWRLRSMGLAGRPWASAADVVAGLLAVQGENPTQSLWAIGCRTTAPRLADVTRALDEGHVVRTHVLRPTWHHVRADDVRWLAELTGPRVWRTMRPLLRAEDLDDATVARSDAVLAGALADGTHRTRDELAEHLAEAGLPHEGQALGALLAHTELTALVCGGRPRDGAHTYALIDERAPAARRLDRDEALVELAARYVAGHGPVTDRDLAYWASLTLGDVRAGLAEADLATFEHDGRTWWYAEPAADAPLEAVGGHLLQALDEYHNGVQDTRHLLDLAGVVPPGRRPNVGMALLDGQVVGGMWRRDGDHAVAFEVDAYRALRPAELDELAAAASRYGDFLGATATLTTRPPGSA